MENFSNIFIKEIRFGQSEGGVACGPIDGEFHVGATVIDGDKQTHHYVFSEFMCFPEFSSTTEDNFDYIVKGKQDNKYWKFRKSIVIQKLGNVNLAGNYDELFNNIYSNNLENTEEGRLIRCLVTLMRCDMSETEKLIKEFSEKYIKDLTIPISDVEDDYLNN